MEVTTSIVKIQDLFEGWRQLGHQRLRSGVELIGHSVDEDGEAWLHALFPGLPSEQIEVLERNVNGRFPPRLRAFYRLVGGMSLFNGSFRMFGRRAVGIRTGLEGLQADDLVELNHSLDAIGWKPNGAIAFAVNGWDQSVHLANMGTTPEEIVRCDRTTGRMLESHANVFKCISERLYRLDQVLIQ